MIHQLVTDLLVAETEVDDPHWGLGMLGDWNRVSSTDGHELQIAFDVVSSLADPAENAIARRMHYWLLNRDSTLHYRRGSGPGQTMAMDIRVDPERGRIDVTANRLIERVVRFRFNNLHSPGYVMTDIVCELLAERGWAPMHCSAVVAPDGGLDVIVAPPNTGKTLTAMTLVREHGYSYVAEDLGFCDGSEFRGVTWTSTFRYYPSLQTSKWQKARMKATEIIPPLELIRVKHDTSLLDLVRPDQISGGGPVKRVIVLSLNPDLTGSTVSDVAPEDAYRYMRNLNRYEFRYESSPVIAALEGLLGAVDVDRGSDKVRAAVRHLADSVPVHLVEAGDPTLFAAAIASR